MIKVMVVAGTRPEAIKLAMVVLELRKIGGLEVQVVTTSQHPPKVVQGTLSEFGITLGEFPLPKVPHSTMGVAIGTIISDLASLFACSGPDLVVCQGDTISTLAAALAAFYCGIP